MHGPSEAFPLDEASIGRLLDGAPAQDPVRVRDILARARELRGLDEADLPVLMAVQRPDLLDELFHAAEQVKEEIYGRRIVLFAPLYVSNLCGNECLYCAFRASNRGLARRALGQAEIAAEVRQSAR